MRSCFFEALLLLIAFLVGGGFAVFVLVLWSLWLAARIGRFF